MRFHKNWNSFTTGYRCRSQKRKNTLFATFRIQTFSIVWILRVRHRGLIYAQRFRIRSRVQNSPGRHRIQRIFSFLTLVKKRNKLHNYYIGSRFLHAHVPYTFNVYYTRAERGPTAVIAGHHKSNYKSAVHSEWTARFFRKKKEIAYALTTQVSQTTKIRTWLL